jgi:hypothetical protein
VALSAALACALALGGCSDVAFQGRIFDAMGLSDTGPEPDVRMAERPPLLLPPDMKALPAPANGVAAASAREDWPQNPEIAREQAVQAKKDKLIAEEKSSQPLHPYIGKTLLDKWITKKKPEGAEDQVPEPDPAVDKQEDNEAVANAKRPPLQPHVPQEITPVPAAQPTAPDSYRNPNALW